MTRHFMHFTIALLLLAASPETAPATAAPETPQSKPLKAKKICRAGSATGSRMTSKICKTQAEWDAQMDADATRLDSQRAGSASY
jgi:hypothetical protein